MNKTGWIEFKDLQNVQLEYRDAFIKAQSKLNAVLANQPPNPVDVEGRTVLGVLIDASTKSIDGPQGVLGKAGPSFIRTRSGLPIQGIMEFDNDDLGRLKEKGELEDVILHEMFHVLGSGTLWLHKNLLAGPTTNDPRFTGKNAVTEYQALTGNTSEDTIPVANTGGAGTRNGHWRETTFGIELNTGYLSGNHRPLSRMSLAALIDIGYNSPVMEEADEYQLPEVSSVQSLISFGQCCSTIERPGFRVVLNC